MQSVVASNMTIKETKEVLQPLFSVLHRLNVSYNARFNHADNLFVQSHSPHSCFDLFAIVVFMI